MIRKTLTLTLLGIAAYLIPMQAQTNQKHWETILDIVAKVQFYNGSATPPSNWKLKSYTPDNDWKTNNINVVGYKDMLTNCNVCGIAKTGSTIYARAVFNIKDTGKIESFLFGLLYLDGIVIYINGAEVFRANLGEVGTATTDGQKADATLPMESLNCEFMPTVLINKELFKDTLKNGENILAIEVHNDAVDKQFAFYQLWMSAEVNSAEIENTVSIPNYPFQISADSSEIPIVMLNVPSGFIPDEPKVPATMKIIDNGAGNINRISDTKYAFEGSIEIERRGSSSQDMPKHSYGFKIVDKDGKDTSFSLLGMPKESDWILKGEMMDKTLLRDYLTFELARKTNHYSPRSRFCELYYNGKNVGLFAIEEKIKRDTFRVDIAKLKSTDNTGLDVTGGYILKLDKNTGSASESIPSKYKTLLTNHSFSFQLEYPKIDDITAEQKTYIKTFMDEFETALHSENYKDPAEGYRKYISVKSFIDYLIMQELARNVDGYRLSTFMYKEKDKSDKLGKLHMGPLWDFNLAYGYSGELCNGTWSREGWAFDYNKDCPNDSYFVPFWWDRLHQDPAFRAELKARWNELRKGPLHQDSINSLIDNTVATNKNAIDRNYTIWQDVFAAQIWPYGAVGKGYNEEISYLKNFITERLAWMDTNLPSVREEVMYPVGINYANNNVSQIKVYPVPFITDVTFEFAASNDNKVKLSVFNLSGQAVYSNTSYSTEGINYLKWNGKDGIGNTVKSGIYVYTLELNDQVIVRNKIVKY